MGEKRGERNRMAYVGGVKVFSLMRCLPPNEVFSP